MTPIVQHKSRSTSLAFFRKAHEFVRLAGWPQSLPFAFSEVSWQISPDDYTMRAIIKVDQKEATALLTINYMGREINMVHIRFDGNKAFSEGLLFKDNLELAFQCFRSHAQNMMHGPVQYKEAA